MIVKCVNPAELADLTEGKLYMAYRAEEGKAHVFTDALKWETLDMDRFEETKVSDMEEAKIIARNRLLYYLPQASYTIYTKINHVAKSGMSRSVSFYMAVGSGEIIDVTVQVGHLFDKRPDRYNGVTFKGCGYDVGADAVMRVSRKLYDDDNRIRHYWL